MQIKSLEYSSAYTLPVRTRERVSDLRFANVWFGAMEAVFGLNRVRAGEQRSFSQCRTQQLESRNAFPKPLVLIVEDNPPDLLLVREALREHSVNCEVAVAVDGDEAADAIDQIDAEAMPVPELIILDLNLPKRSGYEVLVHIRDSAQCANQPVIILTSSDAPKDREEAARLGATLYIQKPSNLEDFMKIGAEFKRLLSRTNGRERE
jgi:CheY-like chemotaxis protein